MGWTFSDALLIIDHPAYPLRFFGLKVRMIPCH